MVVEKHILKTKIQNNLVAIIQVSQFSMIPKKDGHAVIKLFMIGINLKKLNHVLLENIQM